MSYDGYGELELEVNDRSYDEFYVGRDQVILSGNSGVLIADRAVLNGIEGANFRKILNSDEFGSRIQSQSVAMAFLDVPDGINPQKFADSMAKDLSGEAEFSVAETVERAYLRGLGHKEAAVTKARSDGRGLTSFGDRAAELASSGLSAKDALWCAQLEEAGLSSEIAYYGEAKVIEELAEKTGRKPTTTALGEIDVDVHAFAAKGQALDQSADVSYVLNAIGRQTDQGQGTHNKYVPAEA